MGFSWDPVGDIRHEVNRTIESVDNRLRSVDIQWDPIGDIGHEIQRSILDPINNYLGELTGANALREQIRLSEERIKKEDEYRKEFLLNEQNQAMQDDIFASNQAMAARGGSSGGPVRKAMRYSTEIDGDYLGL